MQFYKVSTREKEKQRQLEEGLADGTASPKKRPRVRLEGPW
jgi:phosphatidylserine decarboxylase